MVQYRKDLGAQFISIVVWLTERVHLPCLVGRTSMCPFEYNNLMLSIEFNDQWDHLRGSSESESSLVAMSSRPTDMELAVCLSARFKIVWSKPLPLSMRGVFLWCRCPGLITCYPD